MSVLGTMAGVLGGSTGSAIGRETVPDWTGAYWCLECDYRMVDVEADGEDPSCPECGGEMGFERSMNSGCGC